MSKQQTLHFLERRKDPLEILRFGIEQEFAEARQSMQKRTVKEAVEAMQEPHVTELTDKAWSIIFGLQSSRRLPTGIRARSVARLITTLELSGPSIYGGKLLNIDRSNVDGLSMVRKDAYAGYARTLHNLRQLPGDIHPSDVEEDKLIIGAVLNRDQGQYLALPAETGLELMHGVSMRVMQSGNNPSLHARVYHVESTELSPNVQNVNARMVLRGRAEALRGAIHTEAYLGEVLQEDETSLLDTVCGAARAAIYSAV